MKHFAGVVLALAAGGFAASLAFDAQPALAYDALCPTKIADCGWWIPPTPVCIDGVCEHIPIPLLGDPQPM